MNVLMVGRQETNVVRLGSNHKSLDIRTTKRAGDHERFRERHRIERLISGDECGLAREHLALQRKCVGLSLEITSALDKQTNAEVSPG